MEKQERPATAKRSPARKWLRRIGITLAGIAALLLLVVVGFPLALSLRPPPKTVRVVATIPLPGHSLLAGTDYVTLDGGSLYVACFSQNRLVKIDTRTDQVVGTVEGLPGVHGYAADPKTHLGFVSDSGNNMVGVVDLSTNRLLSAIPGGVGPDAIISDPKARLIYAADHSGKSATLIDPRTRQVIGTVPLGGEAEFAQADPATGLVYQNLEDTDEVVVVDPAKKAVTARYKTAPGTGPTGLALDAAHRRLFCVCGNKTLVVLNTVTGQVVASLPIGSVADSVGYDPGLGRIYTANAVGTMTIIQQDGPDSYHVLETAPTPLGGHTLAVDPATHRIYVACAGFGAAKVAVFEPVP